MAEILHVTEEFPQDMVRYQAAHDGILGPFFKSWLYSEIVVLGQENIPDPGTPFIAGLRHTGMDDHVPYAVALDPTKEQPPRFFAHEKLFELPISRFVNPYFMGVCGAIPMLIGRGQEGQETNSRRVRELLEVGQMPAIYPEGGTNSNSPDTVGDLFPGLETFARENGVMVLPAAIYGNHVGSWYSFFTNVRKKLVISIGEPFNFLDYPPPLPEQETKYAQSAGSLAYQAVLQGELDTAKAHYEEINQRLQIFTFS